jgi:hypothetical protein
MECTEVSAPISQDAQQKMSDEQWLRAMRKYAGVDDTRRSKGELAGGEYQLAQSLEGRTKADPKRFALLALQMNDELPSSYFDAILRGIANWVPDKNAPDTTQITTSEAAALVRRVHALPGRPCGRSVSNLVQRWKGRNWPTEIIEAVAWYAVNDSDPDKEQWQQLAYNGKPYYGGEPYTAGINSTRGEAAGAIQQLLFDAPERFPLLEKAVNSLAHDKSVAVRSCALGILLPLLNVDAAMAIQWFKECVDTDPAILSTPNVERFIKYAGYRDYISIHPILQVMLNSEVPSVAEAGSRQTCVLSLTVEGAALDAERVQGSDAVMRKAAADVYARNVAHKTVGHICRCRLKPFFVDEDDEVRAEAASAFHQIADLTTPDQADLLAAFLDGNPGRKALEPVVRALEDSPVQLPDLVCRFVKLCIEAFRAEAGDIRTWGAAVAMDLSKIVVRLYSQTENSHIQSQCLDLIDEMERSNFMGLSDELRKLDR